VNDSDNPVQIHSRDYWFKVVGMLQQNWALIEPQPGGTGLAVHFIDDQSGVFDRLDFADAASAERALRHNGFAPFAEDAQAQRFLRPPPPPFRTTRHCNGPIYSSGRFWQQP